MVQVARVEATITAQNKLRPGLAASARELERFRAQQSKATSAFGSMQARALAGIGGALAGFSVARGLNDATKRFAAVDRAMTRTGITGDATAEQTRRGSEELRNLARETATLFDPAQKGLDAITASGRDFTDAMKMMPSVLKTAQASGAGVDDIANSSTALLDHMKISIDGLAEAQDTLAMGGKLGKFELKDMARYLPSMLPAFKALGQSGQEGLRNLVATLQVIRSGTGTAEEAAASAQNIFSKMESEETVKNFAKFGVDLPKAMTKARKEGKNLLDVFLDLSQTALKGDLSKVPQLFKDYEVQRGMRPLLEGLQKRLELVEKLKGAKGTIDTDFKRVSEDTQARLDRLKEASDRAATAVGSVAAELASDRFKTGADNLDAIAQAMERAAEAARTDGFIGAVKSLGGALVDSVSKGIQDGPGIDGLKQQYADSDAAAQVALRARKANAGVTDPREAANLRHEIAELERRSPSAKVQGRIADLKARLNGGSAGQVDVSPDEIKSILRDQQRQSGLPSLKIDLTSSSPEFDTARESARETRRAFGLGGPGGSDFPTTAVKTTPGSVNPPVRPSGNGIIPVAPLDEVRTKADAVATSFGLLGPAAQNAGGEIASGFGTGLTEVQRMIAEVARLQQALGNLRVPPLSFGGFDTGKSMQELRR